MRWANVSMQRTFTRHFNHAKWQHPCSSQYRQSIQTHYSSIIFEFLCARWYWARLLIPTVTLSSKQERICTLTFSCCINWTWALNRDKTREQKQRSLYLISIPDMSSGLCPCGINTNILVFVVRCGKHRAVLLHLLCIVIAVKFMRLMFYRRSFFF